jgi:hypothetical protein
MNFFKKHHKTTPAKNSKQTNQSRLFAPKSPALRLATMLQWKRPAGSQYVQWFIDDFLSDFGGWQDQAGNYFVQIGTGSRVLWSSHTDTVHSTAGHQKISISGDLLKVSKTETSSCLGADCTTGVWLMSEMITAGVAGLYCFFADEEIGGQGSSDFAKTAGDQLAGIDYAIAFDRKGKTSVITHQGGQRCCSDLFADSLAALLPAGYQLDTGGTFTDTANLTDLIGECSNISVGYEGAHSAGETQSISHALALREKLLHFDETKLVKHRQAGDPDPDWNPYAGRYYNTAAAPAWAWYDDFDQDDLEAFVQMHPDLVAQFLLDQGFNLTDLHNTIENRPRYLMRGA